MLKILTRAISDAKIQQIKTQVTESASDSDEADLIRLLKPLLAVQSKQENAAECLIELVQDNHLSVKLAQEVFSEIFSAHTESMNILSMMGAALEGACDIDMLNNAPPEAAFISDLVAKLEQFSKQTRGTAIEEKILDGLSTAARMLARQHDEIAEATYRRLLEIDPDYSAHHYSLGLFCKTRGHFAEGVKSNQMAAGLVEEPVESYQWNLGICATGAGQGELALEVWKGLGQKIEMGRFGLPEGGYPQCKVRLAERPLAERTRDNDDPGLEETIWIERLSPCHGIIRSVLYQDIGINYGDVILMDGAPITYHSYDQREVPVFPHLATLQHQEYQIFDFIGTQEEGGQIAILDRDFDEDIVIYPHTENFRVLCSSCWRDPNTDHEHHQGEEKHIVSGKIAAPKYFTAIALLEQLDSAIASHSYCKIYVPSLCKAADQLERAEIESRRFNMLNDNSEQALNL